MKRFLLIFFSILIVLFLLWKSFYHKEKFYKETRFLMDTYCTIQAFGKKGIVEKAVKLAFKRMEEIDKKFNILNPESPIYDFNKKNVPITDKEIIALVKTSLEVSSESAGAFDITVYPLVKLWGFYGDRPEVPDKKEIKKVLKNVGYKNLIVEDRRVKKENENSGIDLGGIAKGYALKKAARILKENGIKSALIDAGGDIFAIGKINGRKWRIGIKNPDGEGIIGVIEVKDMAIVTSGDYERFFEKDGIRYHHIIDPKTGYPSRGVRSVTVLSSDPTLADAWSTAIFVMGEKRGLEIAKKNPMIEAVIVTKDGEILYTSGLKGNLEILK